MFALIHELIGLDNFWYGETLLVRFGGLIFILLLVVSVQSASA
jgi:hypothetical protein